MVAGLWSGLGQDGKQVSLVIVVTKTPQNTCHMICFIRNTMRNVNNLEMNSTQSRQVRPHPQRIHPQQIPQYLQK